MENSERKLVTLRKISKFIPIEGADNIQLAIVDGWSVIVKKEEFKVNDYCLFFEIDSFIPIEDQRFSFLKPQTYLKKEGYRIKTMKLRGSLSQGLALPLRLFPEIIDRSLPDYAELLGVIKYDNAAADPRGNVKVGNAEGKFPSFIPKTDQERVQNLTHYFETLKGEEFEATLKLDGSSMTCYKIRKEPSLWDKIKRFFGAKLQDYHFGVCSRNLELKRPKDSSDKHSDFWSCAKKLDIENKLPQGYALQGELIGPKIQANHEKVQDLDYFVFDVYDINESKKLLPKERQQFCFENNIKHVPLVDNQAQPFNGTLEELLVSVDRESINKGTISEGQVFKHLTKNITFKVINNKYLLKSEK